MTSKIIISIFDSIPLWVMIAPILLCSVVLLAVIIERVIFYRRIDMDYRLLMNSVIDYLKSKKINDAKNICISYSGPLIEIISMIIDRWGIKEDKELIIRDISEKAIRKIEKYGGIISTISTISPMLGLLGTVTGMMQSFSALSQLGPTATDSLAEGITVALITTALGLLVAIPAVMFYNYMVSRVEFFVREVEYISNSLNDIQK